MTLPTTNPNRCIVCMSLHPPSKLSLINLCCDECKDEYRDVINEMSLAFADEEVSLNMEDLKAILSESQGKETGGEGGEGGESEDAKRIGVLEDMVAEMAGALGMPVPDEINGAAIAEGEGSGGEAPAGW